MDFRARLIATLRAVAPVLEEPGVLVVGSEVPNLLQPDAASTLVVSQDVDVGIPVAAHARVKRRLGEIRGLAPSPEERSVWVPEQPDLIEVNFLGMDPSARDISETYVLEDADLPLLVFGPLSLLEPGDPLRVEDLVVPVPRAAGLLLEKLLTDRTGEKGDRDLLVVAGLLGVATDADLDELVARWTALPSDLRHGARSNLTLVSLLAPRAGMPDPVPRRAIVSALLARFDRAEGGAP